MGRWPQDVRSQVPTPRFEDGLGSSQSGLPARLQLTSTGNSAKPCSDAQGRDLGSWLVLVSEAVQVAMEK